MLPSFTFKMLISVLPATTATCRMASWKPLGMHDREAERRSPRGQRQGTPRGHSFLRDRRCQAAEGGTGAAPEAQLSLRERIRKGYYCCLLLLAPESAEKRRSPSNAPTPAGIQSPKLPEKSRGDNAHFRQKTRPQVVLGVQSRGGWTGRDRLGSGLRAQRTPGT